MTSQMSGNEVYGAEGFLEQTFKADPLLNNPALLASTYCTGFWSESAPKNAVGRYIIWSYRESPDTVAGHYRVAIEPLFVVKVVGKTSRFEDLQAVADQIDFDLQNVSGVYHDAQGRFADRIIRRVVREDLYRLVENTDAGQYRHLGGYYRFYIQ